MTLRMMLLAAAALSAPAQSAWHKATSPHFIIYADESPAELKAYAEKLERFDKAVRLARGTKDPALSPGNRPTVYVVADATAVAKLHKGIQPSVAGFYRVRGTDMIAVVPRRLPKNTNMTPDTVFFHEYAHHLMFQDISTPIPSWLTEGFAEFYGTADVNADGSVGIGGAPIARARTLRQTRNPLPFTQMLAGATPTTGPERGALYARGWLLTHYLTFSKARAGQLQTYLNTIAAGTPAGDAARAAFGDLGQLEVETEKYLLADKFPYLTLPASALPIGAATVTPLGVAGEAIMPLKVRLSAGGDENKETLAAEIRTVAARFPTDELVQLTLAEAELINDRFEAARAACEAALKANPQSVDAMILTGRAIVGQAKAKAGGATFAEARSWFTRANRLDPENPLPLVLFYDAYVAEGGKPTANAIAAMRYAANLAPQAQGLRVLAARSYLAEGKKAEARRLLVPVAYNPHGGKLAEDARKLLEAAN